MNWIFFADSESEIKNILYENSIAFYFGDVAADTREIEVNPSNNIFFCGLA